ncbi:phage tail sheath N-terminal beta-sandwich domain-containing protein [Clostridium sp. KNHs216]|uniref:phage tail sheath N-terminal beta-sandwich domain-containing protein n=1 Tax=Clostridium sp. KNHs216 TaxID=1550235 RepID=UPI00115471B0|nr:phage tail sheath N-terminal beta-sandwich domain-containing protein [Clostridium sp. KNHs216]TQI69004.1 tail sheath protein [Clostridium sp. KNHs216]
MSIQILPGTQVTVKAGARPTQLVSTGIVAMPLELNWGGILAEINSGNDTLYSLGYKRSDFTGAGMKLINEVLNYADKLILYRSNTAGGVQASGTLAADVTATAKYVGTRGNDITVTVTASGEQWIIKTLLGSIEVDSQIVSEPSEFQPNDFLSITGEGTLAAATVKLTNGANGTIQPGTVDLLITELEKHELNVLCYTGSTPDTITKLRAFVAEQRKKNNMIQAVMSGIAANNVAVYNSTVGGVTENYALTAREACATLAGLIAKQGITGSLTHYNSLTGWTDVNPHLTREQMESRTQAGEILFTLLYGIPAVLYDINSLTTYTDDQPEDFHKGLIMRTLDNIAMNIQKLLDTKAVGKIRNHKNGRQQIKAMVVKLITENYVKPEYIEDFTADDVTIDIGTESDAITATVDVQVVDTTDKIQVAVTSLAAQAVA